MARGLVALVALTGCVMAPHPVIQAPDQYVVEYDPIFSGLSDAAALADAHCAKTDRRAVLTGEGRSGDLSELVILSFVCG
ncbi:MAG TPA: hypothetical protein VD978_02410 [Azospirillum sp.]|nr:hypothetical protein [Azospirillum sp.]